MILAVCSVNKSSLSMILAVCSVNKSSLSMILAACSVNKSAKALKQGGLVVEHKTSNEEVLTWV